MRKAIAVAAVAWLILGAASAVSAQEWSIGFEGVFRNNFGGGFKGDVTSPVADTILLKIMPKFVSVKTTKWFHSTRDAILGANQEGDPIVGPVDTAWWETTADSGLVGSVTDSVLVLKRAEPDTKEMFTPHYSGGGGVFFSSKYAEATVGLAYMGGTWKRKVVGSDNVRTYTTERVVTDTVRSIIVEKTDNTISVTYDSIRVIRDRQVGSTTVDMNSEWEKAITALNVNVGLWLKYPYELTDAAKLFPMAGVEYEICTIITKDIRRVWAANNWSRAWFKAGVGGDFGVSERVYIHPVVLYGVGWKNSIERGMAKEGGVEVDTKVSHGLTARIGVGYRFNFD